MECDLRGGYPVCGRLSTPPAAIVIRKKYPDGDRNHKEAGECFSCVSNPNWSFYQQRISGLKNLNASSALPVAPLACTFDPMRIYADRTAVACPGYCVKWTSAVILQDGGVEVNVLRGCFDTLVDKSIHQPPQSANCYQDPHDYSHRIGVEYKSICYCKGFMCNSSADRVWAVITFLVVMLIVL